MRERPLYVLGDLHGQRDRMVGLLEGAGLVGDGGWTGGGATLILVGVLFEGGPDGLGAAEVAMRLQEEASAVDGRLVILLGNHEVLLLWANVFGRRATTAPGGTFLADWEIDGGVSEDLKGLRREHVSWLTDLPAMIFARDLLLVHAEAEEFYASYGRTVSEVNGAVRALLRGREDTVWDRLLEVVAQRSAFQDHPYGTRKAKAFLSRFRDDASSTVTPQSV